MSTAIDATASMNRMYRRQRHIYDFTRKHYLLGRDELIARLRPGPSDSVLEIGCGTGRNLMAAAQHYSNTRFFGVDVSTAMLTYAIDSVANAGLSSRIRFAHCDATAFVPASLFGKSKFDRVFLSYTLSMIKHWQAALDVAMSSLTPRGELHIVDFGNQAELPTAARVALRWWLRQFDVVPCDRLEGELRLRAQLAGARLDIERPYRGYAQYAVLRPK
jgi:S-adenosylmethionine-diacylgycerolhomoserine-N-methlytransferase